MAEIIVERKIDPLGRLMLPAEVRRKAGIKPGDMVRVVYSGGKVEVEAIKVK